MDGTITIKLRFETQEEKERCQSLLAKYKCMTGENYGKIVRNTLEECDKWKEKG